MGLANILLYILFYQLNIFPFFTVVEVATAIRGNIFDYPTTGATSRNLHYGNNLFSKKSLDFDPEDEIMYNSDEFEKSMEELPSNNEQSSKKKTLYESNNIIADKKDIVNSIPQVTSIGKMCDINRNSNECLCERSCLPNLVHNFSPCQCIEILSDKPRETEGLHNDQQLSYNKIMSYIPTNEGEVGRKFSSDLNPSSENTISACERACIPHKILSQSPCLCDIVGNVNNNNNFNNFVPPMKYSYVPASSSSLSSGISYGSSSQYNSYPYQPAYSYNTLSYNSPANPTYNSETNFYPTSYNQQNDYKSFQNYAYQPNPDTKIKCKKACFPFVVKSSSPCTCDFNSYKSPYNQGGSSVSQDSSSFTRSSTMSDVDPSYDTMQPLKKPQSNNNPSSQSENSYGNYIPGTPRDNNNQNDHHRKISYTIPRYIGCYKDEKEHGRDLKIDVPIEKLTVEKCVNKCRHKKKRFAGVQYGYLCFCGSRFGRYGKADNHNCTTQCVGDRTQMCGGPWFNSIYSTDGQRYSETQFSFSTPDSMDEIKAEEEKRKNNIKANVRHTNRNGLPRKFYKKRKAHRKLSNEAENTIKLKIKNTDEATTKPPQLNSETQDAAKKDNENDSKNSSETNKLDLEKLKNKLKSLWNKTIEKSGPPAFELSKLNDDDSPFYITSNNKPSTLSLNNTDMANRPHNTAFKQAESDENDEDESTDDSEQEDESKSSENSDNEEVEENSDDFAIAQDPVTASNENNNTLQTEGEDDSTDNDQQVKISESDADDDENNFKV